MPNMETIIVAARPDQGSVEGMGKSPYYPTYGRDNNPLCNFLGITHVHTYMHTRGCAELAVWPEITSKNDSILETKVAKITPRPYQQKAIDLGVNFLMSKFNRSKAKDYGVIVAPTAAGKSIIISEIAAKVGKVVVIQPSRELLVQNHRKFIQSGGEASIYSAGLKTKEIGHVTFCTIQSVKDLGEHFRGAKVIVDEAHLFPAKSTGMLSRFLMDAKVEKLLGLTATPFRLDNGELKMMTRMKAKTFGAIIHCIQVQEMTSGGYWSPMKYQEINFDMSMLRLNSAGTDYTEKSMQAAYTANNTEDAVKRICSKVQEPDHERKSILVFVPSVAQAVALAGKIPGARAVWGDMPTDERDLVIAGFKDGSIPVVVNVNVLSVGFDHPGVDVIIMARPTRSLAWYYQAVGRGTRLDPTGRKKDCWVYDLSGNFKQFGRVEDIVIKEVPGYGWGVFGTKHSRLFTGVLMSDERAWTEANCKHLKTHKYLLGNTTFNK